MKNAKTAKIKKAAKTAVAVNVKTARAKTKRTRKPKVVIRLKAKKTSPKPRTESVETVPHIEPTRFAAVVMAPQTMPDGQTGPFCQVRFAVSGRVERQVVGEKLVTKLVSKPDPANPNNELVEKVPKLEPVIAERKVRSVTGWVRVLAGNERCGTGLIVSQPDVEVAVTYPVGAIIGWVGGYKDGLPKCFRKYEEARPQDFYRPEFRRSAA